MQIMMETFKQLHIKRKMKFLAIEKKIEIILNIHNEITATPARDADKEIKITSTNNYFREGGYCLHGT